MKKTDKVLVTGGAGFIGGHLVDRLADEGNLVRVVDDFSGGVKYETSKAQYVLDSFYEHFAPLESITIEKVLDMDYVFHLAAIPRVMRSILEPEETNYTNIGETLHLLELCKQAKVKKFIFVSSSSVYGDQDTLPLTEKMIPKPKSPYGLQKRTGEEYCRLYNELFGLESIIIRPFNVYGPRMDMQSEYAGVIGKFIQQKKEGKPLTICGDGEQTRDFTYVSDVVDLLIQAMKIPIGKADIFNCGAGNNTSVNEIARLIGGKAKHIGARPNEPRDTRADISMAKRFLKWKPKVSIKKGIKIMKKEYGV